jgi:uncharacterized damage-inducible protein DinB
MDVRDLMIEAFGRVPHLVRGAVDGLDATDLAEAPAPGANTVGWLVWHLTRVQDHHVSELHGGDQLWVTGDWAPRFGLVPDAHNTGYGHGADDVPTVRPESAQVLIDYYDAVHERTIAFLGGVTPDDLDEVVDRRWDPPVTLGVRLVSVVDDDVQHAGQAAYARGIILRRR